ncbi:MAG: hypothetical protein M3Q56_07690, partial [Bacteroidota bacterium]|nr:hypothetical protein [Bacteroidota bacterium]
MVNNPLFVKLFFSCILCIFLNSLKSQCVIDCSNIRDTFLTCEDLIPAADTSLAQVINCIDSTYCVNILETNNGGEGCAGDTFRLTRRYIVDLDCDFLTLDDQDTCTQIFSVVDTIRPTVTCPANTTIQCPARPVFGTPTASDLCDGNPTIKLVSTDSIPGTCPQEYVLTRIWNATDDCGNVSFNCGQSITVEDTTPPTITCPINTTVQCPTLPTCGTPIASDLCDVSPTINVVGTDSIPGTCPQEYVITRTWNATDDCNNTSVNCSQSVSVEDTTRPVITCPANTTLQCHSTTVFGTPTASDLCDDSPIINLVRTDSIPGSCPQEYVLTRTWNATDAALNTSFNCSQRITVEDTIRPSITCPANTTIQCSSTMVFGTPTASDLCDGSPTINAVSTDSIPGTCPQEYVLTRTWNATDDCLNTSFNCSQSITVVDTTRPVITCSANTIIQCPARPVFTPTASDLCNGSPTLNVMSTDSIPGTCPQEYVLTRTWNATDDCGNVSFNCSQSITVEDTTRPVITCPVDTTIQCPATPVFGTPTATDLCDATPTINTVSTDSIPGTCPQEYVLTRTWNATDDCLNTSFNCSQSITVEDTTRPVITCPVNTTIQCPATPVFGTPTATDLCDATPTINTVSTDSIAGTCPQEYVLTRTWNASDDCGNVSINCSQNITVEDTTRPVITCPANTTIQCPATPVFGTPTASDLCDATPTINVVSTDSIAGTCPQEYVLTRTWNATDDCANVSFNCSQSITVEDTTRPVITCPVNTTIQCPATPVFGTP